MRSVQSYFLNNIKQLGIAVLAYIFMLLCLGYHFGDGDQVEVIPLVMHALQDELFSGDFFVQQYLVHGHGVRDGMVRLSLLGSRVFSLEIWYGLLHIVASLILILGCLQILQFFTKDRAILLFTIGSVLGLMYGFNLGGNELYYPQTLPSLMAKSMLVWSVFWWLRGKIWLWILFAMAGGYFQAIAATQIVALCLGASVLLYGLKVWHWYRNRKSGQRPGIHWNNVMITITCLAVIIFINSDQVMAVGSAPEVGSFYELLLWRVPHHFDPSVFGIRNYLLVIPGCLAGMYVLYHRHRQLFCFCALSFIGCLVYGLTYRWWPEILLSQWFKTTIWVKFFSFSALSIALLTVLSQKLKKINKINVKAALLTLMLIAGIVKGPLTGAQYDLPMTSSAIDDEEAIAVLARRLTPPEAVFLIPPGNTSFKNASFRGCYVDYKSTVFDPAVLTEWHLRIHRVYGVSMQTPDYIDRMVAMKQGYLRTINDADKLNSMGITHFISDTVLDQYRLLGSRGRWHLYSTAPSSSGNENL